MSQDGPISSKDCSGKSTALAFSRRSRGVKQRSRGRGQYVFWFVLKTSRDGTASIPQNGVGDFSAGPQKTNQVYYFGGFSDAAKTELYFRNVTALDKTTMSDTERVAGVLSTDFSLSAEELEARRDMRVFTQAPIA
ncbi:hypothetical protein DL766_005152 [Monosporascus sp. MC13-8B]|uniref:Uncharacterized protein n=1 Tax=Monosporascus cannonballus TaxID=155416 RepID=A0ABY0HK28_9PEZI|nr:hypothetical protein DL762_000632 [Monosporascus cannonballus]RYP01423.1 hypothetical protein DL763_000233 [Monosporascus cannonballus]RYP29853.1 hypothetical protein DL766_005152 [Monosporascus sp. MC13-8B]